MTDVLVPMDRSALRAYGAWSEQPYQYGAGGQAVRRFTWICPAVAVQGGHAITLTYFADAMFEARRMNDLAYLAEREQHAVGTLEAMVLAAINGVGYLGLPHPAAEITQDVVGLVQTWVDARGHPEDWAQQVAQAIGASVQRLNEWQQMLQAVGAVPDAEHVNWGLAVKIKPIEPKEDAG